MGGWRDEDGRTASDRKKVQQTEMRATFYDTLRNRPTAFVRPIVSALFVGILVFALINFFV